MNRLNSRNCFMFYYQMVTCLMTCAAASHVDLRLKWPLILPLRKPQFRPISAHSASTVRAGEKIQIVLIGNRPRAFQRAIVDVYVIPKSTKWWHKRDFAVFASRIQQLSKKFATKFLRVKTSSGRVVATSFFYLTVHIDGFRATSSYV